MNIKGIVFDRDGTLIDYNKTWGPVIINTLKELAGDEKKLEELISFSKINIEAQTFDPDSILIAGSPADYLPRWAEIINRPYDQDFIDDVTAIEDQMVLQYLHPFSDTKMTINMLYRRDYILGLATNGTKSSANAALKAMNIHGLFNFIAGYDSGYGQKPSPGMLNAFARQNNLKPEQCIMIGDTLHDINAALAAGFLSIALLIDDNTAHIDDNISGKSTDDHAPSNQHDQLTELASFTATSLSDCLTIIDDLQQENS